VGSRSTHSALSCPPVSARNLASPGTNGTESPLPDDRLVVQTPASDTRKRTRTRKSMSRRSGQSGHIEKSGNWYIVRWWMDVEGQEQRRYKRERICPISGPDKLSASARERKAKEIIAASGADSVEHFDKVVRSVHGTRDGTWLAFCACGNRGKKCISIYGRPLRSCCPRRFRAACRVEHRPFTDSVTVFSPRNLSSLGVIQSPTGAANRKLRIAGPKRQGCAHNSVG
jgi:hypothetical protein